MSDTEGVVVLSETSAAVVTATLPAVQAHGEAITGRFYQRMFDAHPELLDIFNRGNQATGQQKAALAAAVVAYAEHLTGGSTVPWGPILDRIAHKHASLGITAAQYPIVGRHLLAAVGEVLGDAVTPEVAAAWDEVYWLLACELIAREARLYAGAGVPEGGAVWREWRVVEKIRETADVATFTLVPADGGPVPGFTPGQYVSVAVDLDGDRGQQIRQYSLSGRPGADHWQITVKRVRGVDGGPDGMVSSFLHERVAAGDTLRLSPPFGEVSAIGDGEPLLLVSAGIGLTPAMAALAHLADTEPERPVALVHADRAGAAHARRRELVWLQQRLPNLSVRLWYEDAADAELSGLKADVAGGLVDPALIPVAPESYVHLCGPVPFMSLVRSGLLRRGVPAERIAYEVFGPGMLH
ncbi:MULTISPECIES: globin domain-containing protein [Micromonospora]|uniref:nitric oxide dioxygenase n=1 Tax=Micromonospora solifontis TaxID=2487138 RepID=A0ABX9WH16_9ACTN|nr:MULTISPECIES: globin domain-containing protein [Micromonospora]NES15551.1 hemin transporter [Micromonospora sp. PPF5-17B]NES36879.1 hemin transporter [Micromonospora solifontis]NES55222.1 hemin transporter [Micromonospora sp. PPF5-6]RNL98979.1 hemin transporter [Micromonospora solifontis]